MQKLLLFFLLLLSVFLLRRWSQHQDSSANGGHEEISPPQNDHFEKVLECRRCGVMIPESEAIFCDGEYFCSEAHAREFKAGGGRL